MTDQIKKLAKLAIQQAKEYEGATAPNPIVGAAALTEDGFILGVEAHKKAGAPHAEVNLLQSLYENNCLDKLHTLLVTLEPCCHWGQTPPCTQEIMNTRVKHVIIGAIDPNPIVSGHGAAQLREKTKVSWLEEFDQNLANQCKEMIRPYAYWINNKKPWIILKQAFNLEGAMIPAPGKKTFTSKAALTLAHSIRRKSDAILTGSGTVLSDNPLFTVRHVNDHLHKHRWLILFDRRNRIPKQWKYNAMHNGFYIMESHDIDLALRFLGNESILTGLVEAGPTLSTYILENNLWNEKIEIFQGKEGEEDTVIQSFHP